MTLIYLRYYFYFLLVLFFGAISYSSPIISQDIFYISLIYLYTLLLLPFFDTLLGVFNGEKVFSENICIVGRNPTYYTILIGVISLAWYMNQSFLGILLLSTILFGIFFGINSKIPFFVALILLLYIPFLLFTGNQQGAENCSIFVYYFLVIGVFFEIRAAIYPKIILLGK